MPLYEYICRSCAADFDVVCPISEIDNKVECPRCDVKNDKADRQLTRTHFYGAAVEDATFDHAFGKVIKNSKHRKDEAKARGYIEVGNETPEVVHKYFDKKREEIRADRWADADREKVYE